MTIYHLNSICWIKFSLEDVVKRKNTPLFKKNLFFLTIDLLGFWFKAKFQAFYESINLIPSSTQPRFLPVSRPLFLDYRFTVSIFWSASVTHQVQGDCALSARSQNTAPGPFGPQKFIGAIPCSIGWVTNLMVISQPLMDSRHRRIRI